MKSAGRVAHLQNIDRFRASLQRPTGAKPYQDAGAYGLIAPAHVDNPRSISASARRPAEPAAERKWKSQRRLWRSHHSGIIKLNTLPGSRNRPAGRNGAGNRR